MEYYLLSGEILTQWGYGIRHPNVSASQGAFTLPPPSTIIGAIACGLARVAGWSETYLKNGKIFSATFRLAKYVAGVGVSVDGFPMTFSDIERLAALPYIQKKYRKIEQASTWFSLQSVEKIILPGCRLRLALAFSSDLKKILGEEWLEILVKAFAQISRVGSKESIVSVDPSSIAIKQCIIRKEGVHDTPYYFPDAAGRVVGAISTGSLMKGVHLRKEVFWDFSDISAYVREPERPARLIRYVLPVSDIPVDNFEGIRVELTSGAALIAGEDVLIVEGERIES